jgi:transposase
MPAVGRKSKLNPEVRERLLTAIGKGATYELACKYAGITYQTFLNWKQNAAEQESGAFFELFEDISKAEGEAAFKWLDLLDRHSEADPKWAAWKLERRYPDEYGRTRIEHTGKDGGPINIKAYKGISPDDWDEPTATED